MLKVNAADERQDMFYVLVKFKDQSTPVLFGTTHLYHASKLATMPDVEWVSPTISGNGNALACQQWNGGGVRDGISDKYIEAYTPQPF